MKRTDILKVSAAAGAAAAAAAAWVLLPRISEWAGGPQNVTNFLLVLLLLQQLLKMTFAEINSWKSQAGQPKPHRPAAEPAAREGSTVAFPVRGEPPINRLADAAAEPRKDGGAKEEEIPPAQEQLPVSDGFRPPEQAEEVRGPEKQPRDFGEKHQLGYGALVSRSQISLSQTPRLRLTAQRNTFMVYGAGEEILLEPSPHWFERLCSAGDLLNEQFSALFDLPSPVRGYSYLLHETGMTPALLRDCGNGEYALIRKGRLSVETF